MKWRGATRLRRGKWRGASRLRRGRWRGASRLRRGKWRGASRLFFLPLIKLSSLMKILPLFCEIFGIWSYIIQ